MTIIFKVNSREGEESIWISEINEEEFILLNQVLLEIKKYNGYFPSIENQDNLDPSPEELYGMLEGFKYINGRLPSPIHGFTRIEEVILFSENSKVLYM